MFTERCNYIRSRIAALRYRLGIPNGLWREWKELCRLAVPITITSFIDYLGALVSLMFCGRLGKTELAAAGLAIAIFHIAGLSILYGLLTASETLFAQTFGGENKFRLGIQLQRASCILLFCCMPCWAVHICVEPILLAMKQPPYVARLASNYLLGLMPGLLFTSITSILAKYVQAQKKVCIPLMAGICGNCFNALFHYVLLFHTNFGLTGSAISQSLGFASQMVFLMLYIKISKLYKTTFDGLHVEMWHDWGLWFRLGVPGMIMLSLEWWLCESGSIVSGYLGEKNLAAQSILNNIESILYCLLPLGFAIASTIRIGHYLGANNEKGPRATILVAIMTVGMASIVNVLILAPLRYEVPKIFSMDPEIIMLTGESFASVLMFQFCNGFVGLIAGIVRGAGLQKLGAIVSITTMYGVGAPTGMCLMLLTRLGISGFWWGLSVASSLQVVVYSIIFSKLDWRVQCQRAEKMTNIKFVNEECGITIGEKFSTLNLVPSEGGNSDTSTDVKHLNYETNEVMIDEVSLEPSTSIPADINAVAVRACTPRIVFNRVFLISALFSTLLVSICCRLNLDWGDYFPNYCLLFNKTVLPIPSRLVRHETPEAYKWLATECLALLPS